MNSLSGLKLAIKVAIGHNTTLLALPPDQLLNLIDPTPFTEPEELYPQGNDVNFIVSHLQESLNNLLDCRKRLINLGLYDLKAIDYEEKGIPSRPKVRVPVGNEIPDVLEENGDTDNDTIQFPPDSEMEI